MPNLIYHLVGSLALLLTLSACSPRHLIIQGVANELASQGGAAEDDLVLAREASAFYLKLSESVLRESPGNLKLAEAVSAGFTQYAFAFVSTEAERIESKDVKASHKLRERAARLYLRAHLHGMAALEANMPGFTQALKQTDSAQWPLMKTEQIGVVYWVAASWGAYISLSKDKPDTVADLPLAVRLTNLAYQLKPEHGDGALASLMGSFEAARPGGSVRQAAAYFDQAIALGAGKNAGVFVSKAEAIALPANDRPTFEALLRQALGIKADNSLSNVVMRDRAQWLLDVADDLF